MENGENIIETAIKEFGRVDVLINNAGILRDISFRNMTDEDWDLIMKVHVKGAYKVGQELEENVLEKLDLIRWHSVQEPHGLTSESKSTAESSIQPLLPVYSAALDSATIQVNW